MTDLTAAGGEFLPARRSAATFLFTQLHASWGITFRPESLLSAFIYDVVILCGINFAFVSSPLTLADPLQSTRKQ